MIYFISDLHGEKKFPGFLEYLENAKEEDLLIILGDVCLDFENTDENREFTEFFLSANKNIAIVDGNHENFKFLKSFPEEDYNGGKVHRLTKKIVHLKRGNVFTLEGQSFFVFGGCKSSPRWKQMGLWHEGDEPYDDELRTAYYNLEKYNHQIDYILTHKYEETPGKGTVSTELQKLTQYIDENVRFKRWYAGHWHSNENIDELHALVYDKLTPLAE